MKAQLKTLIILIFLIISSISSQDSKLKEKKDFNWNLTAASGYTYNLDDEIYGETSLSYLEFGIGYNFNPSHEMGIKIGKNDFKGSTLGVTEIQYPGNDTIVIFGEIKNLYPEIWYSLYYRFNYKSWFAGVSLGGISSFAYEYSSFSLGKQFQILNLFYLDVGLNYAIKSANFKYVYSKQLNLIGAFVIKL